MGDDGMCGNNKRYGCAGVIGVTREMNKKMARATMNHIPYSPY